MLDVIASSLNYNISLLEYFQFHFYQLDEKERKTYAGTGTMYEYQLVMNPKLSRGSLDNKVEFFEKYGAFVRHAKADIEKLRTDDSVKQSLLENSSGKVVL